MTYFGLLTFILFFLQIVSTSSSGSSSLDEQTVDHEAAAREACIEANHALSNTILSTNNMAASVAAINAIAAAAQASAAAANSRSAISVSARNLAFDAAYASLAALNAPPGNSRTAAAGKELRDRYRERASNLLDTRNNGIARDCPFVHPGILERTDNNIGKNKKSGVIGGIFAVVAAVGALLTGYFDKTPSSNPHDVTSGLNLVTCTNQPPTPTKFNIQATKTDDTIVTEKTPKIDVFTTHLETPSSFATQFVKSNLITATPNPNLAIQESLAEFDQEDLRNLNNQIANALGANLDETQYKAPYIVDGSTGSTIDADEGIFQADTSALPIGPVSNEEEKRALLTIQDPSFLRFIDFKLRKGFTIVMKAKEPISSDLAALSPVSIDKQEKKLEKKRISNKHLTSELVAVENVKDRKTPEKNTLYEAQDPEIKRLDEGAKTLEPKHSENDFENKGDEGQGDNSDGLSAAVVISGVFGLLAAIGGGFYAFQKRQNYGSV
ncbi:hypothetical protein ROZALSC1DRAFT_23580 [Rozella allomycis CSF55]|uniref:Uncharacterized protein n=1 Tax=Rozella allomycis (strain CSF55) TaxID=988480 RepID=A0A4P9YGE2_ROZAC|nr:hypothetical protein ROZALSC1DRAFT_23580 [Rozella allomycis CSF55]